MTNKPIQNIYKGYIEFHLAQTLVHISEDEISSLNDPFWIEVYYRFPEMFNFLVVLSYTLPSIHEAFGVKGLPKKRGVLHL